MQTVPCKVDNQGRVTLPVEWRKAHNIKTGNEVVITFGDDTLVVKTTAQMLDEAQRIVAPYKRAGHSVVDQLLADRRGEAQAEERGADRHGEGIR